MPKLAEIRETAFAKWLLPQSRDAAIKMIWSDLMNGQPNCVAWDLWAAVHGERKFSGEEIPQALGAMLDALKEPSIVELNGGQAE